MRFVTILLREKKQLVSNANAFDAVSAAGAIVGNHVMDDPRW